MNSDCEDRQYLSENAKSSSLLTRLAKNQQSYTSSSSATGLSVNRYIEQKQNSMNRNIREAHTRSFWHITIKSSINFLDSNMTSNKLVFFGLLLALTGCLKPKKSSNDRGSVEAPRTIQTAPDTAVIPPAKPEVLTDLSLMLNLLPVGSSSDHPKVYADVQSIFQKNCVRCHKAEHSRSPLNLAEFPFGNAANRDSEKQILDKIANRITSSGSPMPPPPDALLPQADRDAILSWIESGALETFKTVGPQVDTANYTTRIQYQVDQNAVSDWITLPAGDSQNSKLSIGKLKAGSTLHINVKVQGPSGQDILVKSFSQIVPENGKIALPIQATAEDQQPPQAGRINTIGQATPTSINLSWTAAVDNVSKANELEYSLYLAPSTASITIDDVSATGTVLINSQKNVTGFKAENLKPKTDYVFALMVKDAKGNRAFYPLLKGKTADEFDDALYPACTTKKFSPAGLQKWRDAAANEAKIAMDDSEALKKVSKNINNCFKDEVPSCFKRTTDFISRRDTAPSTRDDLTTEAKKLPKEFYASNASDGSPRFSVPDNIEKIASEKGWLAVRYKSRAAGGFDPGTSNLLMIYVPGDKVTPTVSFDRWINIAFDQDSDSFADAFEPAPAPTDGILKMDKENIFTMVSLERKASDKPAVVYFQMFERDGKVFKTGANAMRGGLQSCIGCHPNGLRAISPLGYHTRDDQDKEIWENASSRPRYLTNLVEALPAREAKLAPEDWEKVKKMNDAMDEAAGYAAVSWGEGVVNGVTKPFLVPSGQGPIVGPTSPLNGKSRTKDFILGGNGRSGCYKSRKEVFVRDVFNRPTGLGPNNIAAFSKPDLESNPEEYISWEKVRDAMDCEKCHNDIQRGSLNELTKWDEIDFKILVDRSMPVGHEHLNSNERLALANCLQQEFDLEKTLVIDWMTEKTCEQ